MAVNKAMKTFFEAMSGNMIPGDGSKIYNTPMGPFKWDDLQESWININNGFKMSNISMQDLFMMGYDSSSEDNSFDPNRTGSCVYTISDLASPYTASYAYTGTSRPAGTLLGLNPTTTSTLSGYNCTLQCIVRLSAGPSANTYSKFADATKASIQYSTGGTRFDDLVDDGLGSGDSTKFLINTSSFSIGNGGTLRFRLNFSVTSSLLVPFTITVINTSVPSGRQDILVTTVT